MAANDKDMTMTHPTLKPNDRNPAVITLKKAVKTQLARLGDRYTVGHIDAKSDLYGSWAVKGVKMMQHHAHLAQDGIVGPKTWAALGFKDSPYEGTTLRGIPWVPGVVAFDGIWICSQIARELQLARNSGKWKGAANSGYRPDWYQQILWSAALKKYGSEYLAAKWVARPGTSKHRFPDARGAADVNDGAAADAARSRLYRPMSWEEWHVQYRGPATTVAAIKGVLVGPVDYAPTQEMYDEAVEAANQFEIPLIGRVPSPKMIRLH